MEICLVFSFRFENTVKVVSNIQHDEFTALHHDILSQLIYEPHVIKFPDPRWHSVYLGAGEEKAVFCVCDHNDRVFALELIDEPHYLNGRFIGGEYFFNKRINSLNRVRAHLGSEFGLTFTGLVKVREFVHGYEWTRFQFDERRQTMFDHLLTSILQSLFSEQFRQYTVRYKDVHSRNVVFEIKPFSQSGIPFIIKDVTGRLHFIKVAVQPIDLR